MARLMLSLCPDTAVMPLVRPAPGLLQRTCACGQHTGAGGECEACRKKREQGLQRAAITAGPTSDAPPIVHAALRSPGRPLDAAARAALEPRLGADFSHVRVHTDAQAAASARSVNALAYTVGRDVVFGAGQYAPSTRAGQRLLAHELTHVIQQGTASPGTAPLAVGPTDDAFEREADSVAHHVTRAETSAPGQTTGRRAGQAVSSVQREPDPQAPTAEQMREAQLRSLATRPSLALRQWGRLSQADRDQVLWTMISTSGAPFAAEFQKYAKGDKKPNLGPPGALKGFNYTPSTCTITATATPTGSYGYIHRARKSCSSRRASRAARSPPPTSRSTWRRSARKHASTPAMTRTAAGSVAQRRSLT